MPPQLCHQQTHVLMASMPTPEYSLAVVDAIPGLTYAPRVTPWSHVGHTCSPHASQHRPRPSRGARTDMRVATARNHGTLNTRAGQPCEPAFDTSHDTPLRVQARPCHPAARRYDGSTSGERTVPNGLLPPKPPKIPPAGAGGMSSVCGLDVERGRGAESKCCGMAGSGNPASLHRAA
jgi:hypothetical protein